MTDQSDLAFFHQFVQRAEDWHDVKLVVEWLIAYLDEKEELKGPSGPDTTVA